MNHYPTPTIKDGQAFCEGCGAICIDWSVKPLLLNGQFFNLCKTCQRKHREGTLIPLCYQSGDSEDGP